MPLYEFVCDVCNKSFDLLLSIKNYLPDQTCPKCNQHASRVFEPCQIKDESHMTLGSYADKQADKLSDKTKKAMKDKQTEYLWNRDAPSTPRLRKDQKPTNNFKRKK
jgi:putative FmdB family regulatory protein